ncbi:MAG: HAD-IIIC family phosphatase [Pseudomonadales bacterium]|nr:HAD-IIIC family phosphatase [Pseudomonadales bacterium]
MDEFRLERLPWLPVLDCDLNAELDAIQALVNDANESEANLQEAVLRLRGLANHQLKVTDAYRLERFVERFSGNSSFNHEMQACRLGVIANSTLELLRGPLRVAALRHGIAVELVTSPYNQAYEFISNPNSPLYQNACDVILLALDQRNLPFWPEQGESFQRLFEHVQDMLELLKENTKARIILQTLALPSEATFGRQPGDENDLYENVRIFNRYLVELATRFDCLIFDLEALTASVGVFRWHSPVQWCLNKQPFAPDMLPLYCDHIGRLLTSIYSLDRRCLVLDLDNTLWAGVVGDDGVERLVMAQGDPVGEAHRRVQQMALRLKQSGVILAVSSKNEPDTARLPFQVCADMVLREEDIAMFEASWQDKATQLQAISEHLGMPLHQFVLLDDNPAERKQVREALPDVAVPELPADPAWFPEIIMAAGYFAEAGSSEAGDQRTRQYQENHQRQVHRSRIGDYDQYLASLEMRLRVQAFSQRSLGRVAQLIQRSNQFNLTTRRYSETELLALMADSESVTFQAELMDIFGNNGIISLVICRQYQQVWEIESWLMSCRVLSRRVEEALFNVVLTEARNQGITCLIGCYIPTGRNKLVESFYADLGFTQLVSSSSNQEGESTRWQLRVEEAQPIKVSRSLPQVEYITY